MTASAVVLTASCREHSEPSSGPLLTALRADLAREHATRTAVEERYREKLNALHEENVALRVNLTRERARTSLIEAKLAQCQDDLDVFRMQWEDEHDRRVECEAEAHRLSRALSGEEERLRALQQQHTSVEREMEKLEELKVAVEENLDEQRRLGAEKVQFLQLELDRERRRCRDLERRLAAALRNDSVTPTSGLAPSGQLMSPCMLRRPSSRALFKPREIEPQKQTEMVELLEFEFPATPINSVRPRRPTPTQSFTQIHLTRLKGIDGTPAPTTPPFDRRASTLSFDSTDDDEPQGGGEQPSSSPMPVTKMEPVRMTEL